MYKPDTLNQDKARISIGCLFEESGYSAEMCLDEESLKLAYHLRYKAYLNARAITQNPDECCIDQYDTQKNARTYLIRYQGRPVASVRSLTWSADYDWAWTPSVKYFQSEIKNHLGLCTPLMESNRYVVDPSFKGQKSLIAQMLMYRIQTLATIADGCDHVIAAVRPRHTPFYKRMMNFKIISEPISVSEVDFQIQLLTTPIISREKLAQSNGIAAFHETDLERYHQCLYWIKLKSPLV